MTQSRETTLTSHTYQSLFYIQTAENVKNPPNSTYQSHLSKKNFTKTPRIFKGLNYITKVITIKLVYATLLSNLAKQESSMCHQI